VILLSGEYIINYYSTIQSVIITKRNIFSDDGATFSIQRGVQLSRSYVKYFRHNDMTDLERIMKEVDAEFKKVLLLSLLLHYHCYVLISI
jgi:7-keto-8-aminopelargonate synthetase-like enzyme